MGMTLNQYQRRAMVTCTETSHNFSYMILNLVGEVGEFASKIGKMIRKGKARIGDGDQDSNNHLIYDPEMEVEIQKEAGDILWQLSGLCSVMGWNLEDIAQMNLDKLASRSERGVIVGDGDNR